MEAKVCNYTHLVYTMTHLRCVRLRTIGCVKLHTFVLHTLYLLMVCNFTHLLRKTHLCWLHTFPPYTPFGYTHLSQFYTPSEYTHLSMLHTFWIYTPFPILHTFWIYTPNEICIIHFKWNTFRMKFDITLRTWSQHSKNLCVILLT
jgi:hypothetical protein